MGDIRLSADSAPVDDWKAHVATDKKESYLFFVNMLRAAMLFIAFGLTALVSFSFGHILPVVLGLLIILMGALAVIIDLVRHAHFGMSLTVLACAMILVAVSIG